MTYQEALDIVVERTGHERFRALCQDDHPDHQAWRAQMIRRASDVEEAYPTIARQAKNVVKAAVRFIGNRGDMVDQVEHDRRLAICLVCENFNASRRRCRLCGCVARWKARLASEHCPIDKW